MTDEPSIEVWLDSGEGAERSCNMESRGELPEKECSQRKRRRSGNMNSQKEPPPSGLVPSSGIALVFVEAERRVRDSWRRVGLSSSAREEKWQAFVTQQLTPFVHRYMVEVEGEEQQLIRSNSKRLLTMLVLYSHLKENSRDASPAVSRVLRQVPHLCGRGLSSSDSARSSVSLVFRRDPSWEDLVRLSRQLEPTLLEVMEVHSQQAAQEELELEVERLSALAQFRVGVMDKLLLQQRMLGQRADGITLEDTTSASGQSGVRGTTTSSTHFASAAFASAKSTVHDMSSTRQSTTKRAMAAGDEEELQMLFSAPAYRATLNPRSTSFLLPPRFTAGGTSELVESSPVRVAPHTSTPALVVEKAEEATTSASTSCSGTGGRAVNADDEITDDEVDAFQDASRACGGEADLSLARISQEAEEVLRQVEAQRLLLQCDSDAQLQHIRGLFDEIAKEGHQKHNVLSCTDDSPIMADLLAYVSRLRIADEEVEHPSGNFEEVEQKVNDMRQSASTDLDVPSQDAVERSLQSDLPVAARRALRCFSYVEVMRYVYIVRQTLQYALLRRYYAGVDHGSRSIADCAAEYVSITQDNAMSSVVDYAAALRDGTISSNFVPQKNGLAAVEELDRCLACARQTAVEVDEKRVPLLEMLSVVRRAAPLLQRRQAIQDEQRALQEGSRERLLSKKINMAKQLLYEENLRKCVAKELPVLLGELGGLLKQWQQVAPPGAVLRVRGIEVQRLLEEEATGVRSRAQPTRGRTVSRSMTPAPRALSQSSLMLSQSSISRSRVGSRSPPPRMPSSQGPPKPTLASSLRMKATKAASAAHKSSIPPAVLKPRMRSSLPPPLSKRNGTKPLTATSVERVGKGHLSPLSTNSTTPPSPKQLWRRPEDASSSQDRPRFKR